MKNTWFRVYTEYEPGFKYWFALMWQNHYIQIFIPALVLLIFEIINLDWVAYQVQDSFDSGIPTGIMVTAGCFILPAIILVIIYKGFYQFYLNIKNGTSQ